MNIPEDVAAIAPQMTEWRRTLHAHPETAFEEYRTADMVASMLASWGIEVHRGLAGTGVVGVLENGSSSRTVALRADMDALSMEEQNEFAHRSRVPGKMHACGHDGHVAMLLGAARCLAASRRFDGKVYFIFQPAEENEAGARRMVAEGLFSRFPASGIFGLHNMPGLVEGTIALRIGPIMASSDFFEVRIQGRGAHGAYPHLGIDVISVAAEIVLAFNHVAARTIDPVQAALISVTQCHAGTTMNVIPETASIRGTTRTLDGTVQEQLEHRIRTISERIAEAYGAQALVSYERRYVPTVNHAAETEMAIGVARRVVGSERVLLNEAPSMAAEDFGWMLQAVPGSYAWLGAGRQDGTDGPLHSPRYDFNDRILPIGTSYFMGIVETVISE